MRNAQWSGDVKSRSLASTLPGKFAQLWTERTFTLEQDRPGFRMPLMMGQPGEGGMPAGQFPVTACVTNVDSFLVEAGVEDYAPLASMSDAELTAFRSRYKSHHNVDTCLFLWVELETMMTEDYLKLDRWLFFLEDEQGRQVDPLRVAEHPLQTPPLRPFDNQPDGREMTEPPLRSKKVIELYFAKTPQYGKPYLQPDAKTVKLVMLEEKNPSVRAQGMLPLF